MTRFIERKARLYARMLIERLTPNRRREYYSGKIKSSDLSNEELEVWEGPTKEAHERAVALHAALNKKKQAIGD